MERPHVVPIHGGGVQFEWASQTSELELEIRPTGSIEFLIVDEQEKTFEGPIENPDSSKLFSLSNWFLSEAKSVDDLRLVAHASTY